eukprot:1146916-Pelagomonas_calceolata.AAC.11
MGRRDVSAPLVTLSRIFVMFSCAQTRHVACHADVNLCCLVLGAGHVVGVRGGLGSAGSSCGWV